MRFLGSIEATQREGFFCPPFSERCYRHRQKKALCFVKTCFRPVWCCIPSRCGTNKWMCCVLVCLVGMPVISSFSDNSYRMSNCYRSTVTGGFLFPNVICKWPKYSNASSLLAWATPSKYGVRHTHAVLLWRQTSLVRLSKR